MPRAHSRHPQPSAEGRYRIPEGTGQNSSTALLSLGHRDETKATSAVPEQAELFWHEEIGRQVLTLRQSTAWRI